MLARSGRIDVLVNNAGVGMFGGAEESSAAQVQRLYDVNLFGVIRVINAALPSMRERGQPHGLGVERVDLQLLLHLGAALLGRDDGIAPIGGRAPFQKPCRASSFRISSEAGVWDEDRIKSLIASISRAFPVGALMS